MREKTDRPTPSGFARQVEKRRFCFAKAKTARANVAAVSLCHVRHKPATHVKAGNSPEAGCLRAQNNATRLTCAEGKETSREVLDCSGLLTPETPR
jgi:hypothetical protein